MLQQMPSDEHSGPTDASDNAVIAVTVPAINVAVAVIADNSTSPLKSSVQQPTMLARKAN
jgi:hypothetical protein